MPGKSKMTKIAINRCYGGFSLSRVATEAMANAGDEGASEHTEHVSAGYDYRPEDRAAPLLIAVIERLGSEANGEYADIGIVEIPDDAQWIIEEYDGREWASEVHRTWG